MVCPTEEQVGVVPPDGNVPGRGGREEGEVGVEREAVLEYLEGHRINVNIRQVLQDGVETIEEALRLAGEGTT